MEPQQCAKGLRGFGLNANTVTTGESAVWGLNLIPATSDAKTLMQLIAYDLTHKEQFAAGWIGSKPGRNKVQILSAGGYNTIQIGLPGNRDELMKGAGYRPLSEFFLSAHTT